MRTILLLSLCLFGATLAPAAEKDIDRHKYNFSITDRDGRVLGTGSLGLPFKFGSDGNGTATWKFTATEVTSTNRYWMKAKGRLAKGSGEAKAVCKDSWFTLDFNPGWHDNNVTVSWATKKEAGTVYFADFVGGHPCAFFKISQKEVQP